MVYSKRKRLVRTSDRTEGPSPANRLLPLRRIDCVPNRAEPETDDETGRVEPNVMRVRGSIPQQRQHARTRYYCNRCRHRLPCPFLCLLYKEADKHPDDKAQ